MIYSKFPLQEQKNIEVVKNYYIPRTDWNNNTREDIHIDLCKSLSFRLNDLIYTGQSVCAILRIPRLSKIEIRPHCITYSKRGSKLICWRYTAFPVKTWLYDNLRIVSYERAIVDLAKYDSMESLLVSINHCLNKKLFTKEQLLDELNSHGNKRYKSKIIKVLSLANNKCDSPLETIAFIAIYKAGLLIPEQQFEIVDGKSFIGRVDMYWKVWKKRIVLELDGKIKYTDKDVLYAEKKREDKLRDMKIEVIRATWHDVESGRLVETLSNRGIPLRRYRKNNIFGE